jgi:hypothetical protein
VNSAFRVRHSSIALLKNEYVAPDDLGIENLARTCVQERGVLIDLRRADTTSQGRVGYDALMRLIEAQQAEVAVGDCSAPMPAIAICYCATARVDLAACPGLDGTDPTQLDWIDRSGVAAICADNAMVEKLEGVTRCDGKTCWPPHEHCLIKRSIHFGEFGGSEGAPRGLPHVAGVISS